MPTYSSPLVQPFVPAALAASGVGTWDYDVAEDRCCGDHLFAKLYGLTDAEAEEGVPVERVVQGMHPADRARSRAKRMKMIAQGGLFVVEYQTVPSPGVMRWVLGRGRYDTDASGHARGRGIVIDVTDSKQDGYVEGTAFFTTESDALDGDTPLGRAAACALSTRRAIDALGDDAPPTARPLIDSMLMAFGWALARGGSRRRA